MKMEELNYYYNKFKFGEDIFHQLMQKRVRDILLVSTFYVTKKMYEIDGKKANQYYELGQQKPFACMSLKPGLGDHYYQELIS